MRRIIIAVAAAGAVFAPTASNAEPAPPNTSTGKPEERVCENIVITGSRLAAKRFCGTRAEWAERKRADREALESAQRGPCVQSHNSASGKSAC